MKQCVIVLHCLIFGHNDCLLNNIIIIEGHSGFCSRWICSIILLVAAGLVFVQYMDFIDIITPLRYQLNIMQSRSLPFPSKTFVGRQQKLEELTEYISFSNDNYRIISYFKQLLIMMI